MRHIISLLVLSLLLIDASGQSIDELDKKNGFKTLMIGDKFSKYQSNITLLTTDSTKSASTYEFIPRENTLLYVFDEKMDQILLTFDKNKNLVAITLNKFFKETPDSAYYAIQRINRNFSALFGKASSKIDLKNYESFQLGYTWEGLKINLRSYLEYFASTKSSDIKVLIIDKAFDIDSLKSGF